MTLVELQPRLAELARKNAVENGLARSRRRWWSGDLRRSRGHAGRCRAPRSTWWSPNPPYRPLDEGPASPDEEEAIAQHELRLTLADAVRRGAARCSCPAGAPRSSIPPRALAVAARHRSTAPACAHFRARFVHSAAPDEPANRVLVEARQGRARPARRRAAAGHLRDAAAYTPEAAPPPRRR